MVTTGLHASCSSQVGSYLTTLAPHSLCLKTQRIMGNDRQDSGAFYNQGLWSVPLVKSPFYCVLFQSLTWISATHVTGAHYNDQCHPFSCPCFNRAAVSHAELDLTGSLYKHQSSTEDVNLCLKARRKNCRRYALQLPSDQHQEQ